MSRHLAPETIGNALREVIDSNLNRIYGRTSPVPGNGAHRAEPAKARRKQDACWACKKQEDADKRRIPADVIFHRAA